MKAQIDVDVLAETDIHCTSTKMHTEQSKIEAYGRHINALNVKLAELNQDLASARIEVQALYTSEMRILRQAVKIFAYDKLCSFFELADGWQRTCKSIQNENEDIVEIRQLLSDKRPPKSVSLWLGMKEACCTVWPWKQV